MEINGKTILITGGTGSFGSNFMEHLLNDFEPERVIVYSRDELKQYEQSMKLNDARIHYVIGDVRDRYRLTTSMKDCDIVIHAAAMKQVVAAEHNPGECILTNINGAENVIEAAITNNVQRVIGLSTDKAVNPVNLYGATKLCSDKLIVNANQRSSGTLFSVVRYGNVVGSRGSVVPYFKQLRASGILPITDPEMTRFWITLYEAVRFVSRCIQMMRGAEVFVTRIPSMKILDLAKAIAPECEYKIIGIRPGEKLHEIMIPQDEARRTLKYGNFYAILPDDGKPLNSEKFAYENETGDPVSPDFSYTSDTNPDWVSVEELERLIPTEPE